MVCDGQDYSDIPPPVRRGGKGQLKRTHKTNCSASPAGVCTASERTIVQATELVDDEAYLRLVGSEVGCASAVAA
jgi:hypothetical protein